MQIINSESDLIKKYNQICEKHLKNGSLLPDLTNYEILVYIAGKTYKFGRTWTESVENASHHLQNRQRAEKVFGTKDKEINLL